MRCRTFHRLRREFREPFCLSAQQILKILMERFESRREFFFHFPQFFHHFRMIIHRIPPCLRCRLTCRINKIIRPPRGQIADHARFDINFFLRFRHTSPSKSRRYYTPFPRRTQTTGPLRNKQKLHGLWQCPLQCVFQVLSFQGFSLDASQTQQYFGVYLFSTPSRTPRGKSISLRQSVAHASTKPCFNQFSSLPFIVWLLM